MSATTITAMSVTDDDGTGTTGTIWNAAFQAAFEANINAIFSSATGIRLNQGSGDLEIITLESTDVAHGMTSIVDTAAFGRLVKSSAATGGLTITGFGESTEGMIVQGAVTTEVTTPSTSANGAVRIQGFLKSGTGVTTLGANGLLLVVSNSNTTRFALDADGDSHQDVGTAWTNFDAYDDVGVLHALSVAVSREGDPLREHFGRYLETHREALAAGRFVTFNDDGHHFINWSRVHMLVIGAVRQLGERMAALEARVSTEAAAQLTEGTRALWNSRA